VGIIILLSVAIAVAGIFYWRHQVAAERLVLDPKTYCPVGGALARTVILVDLSDPITAIQQQKLENLIASFAVPGSPLEVEAGDMLELYLLKPNVTDQIPTPTVSICNPGDGEGISEFTGNPRLARKRFEQRFATPLQEALVGLEAVEPANTSPLIEALRGIAVTSFEYDAKRGHENRLYVISDMLQHSAQLSLYKTPHPDTAVLAPLRADLDRVASTAIYVVSRASNDSLQGKEFVLFWQKYFKSSGTTLTTMEKWAE
jgi:hypothetical protein